MEPIGLTTWHDYIQSGRIDDIAEYFRSRHTGPNFTFVKNISVNLPVDLNFRVHEFWGLSDENAAVDRFPGAHGSELATAVLNNEHALSRYVAQELDIGYLNLRITRQRPGKISVFHVDINHGFYIKNNFDQTQHLLPDQTRKYIIFPEDQRPGEFFGFGDSSITWKAGDVFTWPWYMDHGGANSGYQDRYALVVMGY